MLRTPSPEDDPLGQALAMVSPSSEGGAGDEVGSGESKPRADAHVLFLLEILVHFTFANHDPLHISTIAA